MQFVQSEYYILLRTVNWMVIVVTVTNIFEQILENKL